MTVTNCSWDRLLVWCRAFAIISFPVPECPVIKTERFLKEDKKIALEMIRQEMLEAAENLEFERAAVLRDEITNLEREINIIK